MPTPDEQVLALLNELKDAREDRKPRKKSSAEPGNNSYVRRIGRGEAPSYGPIGPGNNYRSIGGGYGMDLVSRHAETMRAAERGSRVKTDQETGVVTRTYALPQPATKKEIPGIQVPGEKPPPATKKEIPGIQVPGKKPHEYVENGRYHVGGVTYPVGTEVPAGTKDLTPEFSAKKSATSAFTPKAPLGSNRPANPLPPPLPGAASKAAAPNVALGSNRPAQPLPPPLPGPGATLGSNRPANPLPPPLPDAPALRSEGLPTSLSPLDDITQSRVLDTLDVALSDYGSGKGSARTPVDYASRWTGAVRPGDIVDVRSPLVDYRGPPLDTGVDFIGRPRDGAPEQDTTPSLRNSEYDPTKTVYGYAPGEVFSTRRSRKTGLIEEVDKYKPTTGPRKSPRTLTAGM